VLPVTILNFYVCHLIVENFFYKVSLLNRYKRYAYINVLRYMY